MGYRVTNVLQRRPVDVNAPVCELHDPEGCCCLNLSNGRHTDNPGTLPHTPATWPVPRQCDACAARRMAPPALLLHSCLHWRASGGTLSPAGPAACTCAAVMGAGAGAGEGKVCAWLAHKALYMHTSGQQAALASHGTAHCAYTESAPWPSQQQAQGTAPQPVLTGHGGTAPT